MSNNNQIQYGGIINKEDCSGFVGTYLGEKVSATDVLKMINTMPILSYDYTPTITILHSEPIKLQAEYVIDSELIKENPVDTDILIKNELARELAKKMIEEDLIKIQYNDDPSSMTHTFRATVKIVQE